MAVFKTPSLVLVVSYANPVHILKYRGAYKSLARPDWIKTIEISPFFWSDAEVIAAETWLDGQPSDFFFLSGLQNLEFGLCGLIPSWSG